MTGDEQAFLAAIRATPADRTVRLVYADWLDERGDPRAELVRVCEAMRRVPVFGDEYWRLKARRNELWPRCPRDWLEATGYDGSDYDPVFRDGVPDDWAGRWRLVREFTERWFGVETPDVGGHRVEVAAVERHLGVELPPSAREFVAYAHDFYHMTEEWPRDRYAPLFHCATPRFGHLQLHPAVSLLHYSLSGGVLGLARDDLTDPDPPAYYLRDGWSDDGDVEYDESGVPLAPGPEAPVFTSPSLSLAVFSNLFIEAPAAGSMEAHLTSWDDLTRRLAADFPVHARIDDADIFEADEMLVAVFGPRDRAVFGRRGQFSGPPERFIEAVVRRPIPLESVPEYLFGGADRNYGSSGMLGPEWFRRQQAERYGWMNGLPPCRWVSPVARREGPPPAPPPPVQPPPWLGLDDDIPF